MKGLALQTQSYRIAMTQDNIVYPRRAQWGPSSDAVEKNRDLKPDQQLHAVDNCK